MGLVTLFDRPVLPADWYPRYVATHLERDLHQMIQVRDLATFQVFVKMCAARTGQVLNLSGLATDCGITHNMAKAWISVLAASYLIFLLRPHHRNFDRCLIKVSNLHFYDTGPITHLLGIENHQHLCTHSMRGHIFENWIVSELLKGRLNRELTPNLFFWRRRVDRAMLPLDMAADI